MVGALGLGSGGVLGCLWVILPLPGSSRAHRGSEPGGIISDDTVRVSVRAGEVGLRCLSVAQGSRESFVRIRVIGRHSLEVPLALRYHTHFVATYLIWGFIDEAGWSLREALGVDVVDGLGHARGVRSRRGTGSGCLLIR